MRFKDYNLIYPYEIQRAVWPIIQAFNHLNNSRPARTLGIHDDDEVAPFLGLDRDVNLIVGMHHFRDTITDCFSGKYGVYNTEFFGTFPDSQITKLLSFIKEAEAYFDVSTRNLKFVKDKIGVRGIWLPLGYSWSFNHATIEPQAYLCVFCGTPNLRRTTLINRIPCAIIATGTWYDKLFGLARKSAINLNIHFKDEGFEIVRVAQLLSNRAFVITEPAEEFEKMGLENGKHYVVATYKDIPKAVETYIKEEGLREKIAKAGEAFFMENCCFDDYVNRAFEESENGQQERAEV